MVREPFFQHDTGRVYTDLYQSSTSQVVVGLSTREKGVSQPPFESFNFGFHVGDNIDDVRTNRSILAEDLSFPLINWVSGEQIHASEIRRVDLSDQGKGALDLDSVIEGVDGLYTTENDLLLVAGYADCVPIYFIHKNYSAVGLAHAGWRGTIGQIGGKMIREWESVLGIDPAEIEVLIGPSIGVCCYEVDDRVINEVKKLEDIELSDIVQPTTPGQYQLNLQLLNQRIIESYGVPQRNIQTTEYCTSCRTDLFYSHRKELGKTGRMLGFIGIHRRD